LNTRPAIVRALVVATVLLFILVVTLAPSGNRSSPPFSFDLRAEHRWLADGILNLCLFVPLGIAVGWNSRSRVRAVFLGLLLSTTVEIAQTIVPGRDPALSDIIFNTVGAAVGALIARRPHAWLVPGARGSVVLTAVSVAAAASVMIATAFLLSPIQEQYFIGRSGDDLLLQYPARASAVGLDEPEYWLPGAFQRGMSRAGPLSLSREAARWNVSIGGSDRGTLGPTLGRGWTVLVYPNAIARQWGSWLNAIWMLALCLPIGFWARGQLLRLVGAVAIIALLAVIPSVTGIVATSSIEWVGAALGFVTGVSLATSRRRWAADKSRADTTQFEARTQHCRDEGDVLT